MPDDIEDQTIRLLQEIRVEMRHGFADVIAHRRGKAREAQDRGRKRMFAVAARPRRATLHSSRPAAFRRAKRPVCRRAVSPQGEKSLGPCIGHAPASLTPR